MYIYMYHNSSMLIIYQNIFKRATIERIYWVVSFQTNVKKGHAWKILKYQPQKFIGWTRLLLNSTTCTSALICVKCRGESGRFNHFKYLESRKSYVSKLFFALLILHDLRFLYRGAKYFTYFNRFLSVKR